MPPPLRDDWSAGYGYLAGLELVVQPDCTAVLAANDQLKPGLLRAFHERGLTVPADIGVVGFDDMSPSAAALGRKPVPPTDRRPRARRQGMEIEPVTPTTPRPVRRPALVQGWHELTFLHWPVEPDRVAGLLPAGTRPDALDGITYVGLVPFLMRGVGLGPGPGLPYLGTFCETNVRLYSVDERGRRGVVFLSLDASRLLPVLVGRLGVRLPYVWSAMRLRRTNGVLTYTCRRGATGRGPTSRAVVRPGAPIARPSPLELFLTARWGMHVPWHGRTAHIPNEHAPWPLHRAELLGLDDDLVTAAGLPRMTDPPVSVLYTPGVSVRFGRPDSVGTAGLRVGERSGIEKRRAP